jgi:hypothetical protein
LTEAASRILERGPDQTTRLHRPDQLQLRRSLTRECRTYFVAVTVLTTSRCMKLLWYRSAEGMWSRKSCSWARTDEDRQDKCQPEHAESKGLPRGRVMDGRSSLSTIKASKRPTEKQRKGKGGARSRGNAPLRFLRLLASLPDGGTGPSSSLSWAPGGAGPARGKGLEKETKISLMDEGTARAQTGGGAGGATRTRPSSILF